MYHTFFDVHAVTATIADGVNAVGVIFNKEIDSKAMRKWQDDGTTLFAKLEVIEIGAANIEVFFDSRVLIKLP